MCKWQAKASVTAQEPGASDKLLTKVLLVSTLALAAAHLLVSANANAAPAHHNQITGPVTTSSQSKATNDNGVGIDHLSTDITTTGLSAHRFRKVEAALEEENYEQAALPLQLLAGQGHQQAQFLLGLVYSNGLGVSLDPQQAIRWYQLAAEQGHIDAQYNLGVAYSTGLGVLADNTKAAGWWRKAAAQGNTDAQFNLGLLYAQGEGVVKNMMEAARWWHQAAKHGDAAAQYALGLMYVRGEGVTQDLGEAVKWWYLSASQGFERAQNALRMLQTLTVED